jgi:hypothetical protein
VFRTNDAFDSPGWYSEEALHRQAFCASLFLSLAIELHENRNCTEIILATEVHGPVEMEDRKCIIAKSSMNRFGFTECSLGTLVECAVGDIRVAFRDLTIL